MKLNGWQRLWLVVSVLVGVGILFARWESLPTYGKVLDEFSGDLLHWNNCTMHFMNKEAGRDNLFDKECWGYTKQIVERERENVVEAKNYKLSILSERQFEWWSKTIGVWLGLNLIVLLGFLCGKWIIRGFKSTKA